MKHLRGNNHRFLCQNTFTDQDALDTRNTFLRNLNAQVTTSNHNAIGNFKNLVNIVHTFLVLNLGNDFNVTAMSIQNSPYIKNVLSVAHERVSNEIYIFLNSVEDIITIFFCQ